MRGPPRGQAGTLLLCNEVIAIGAIYVATTVVLTVYGSLVFKWRIDLLGAHGGTVSVLNAIGRLAIDPWMISVFVATAISSITWGAALTRLELSYVYPFMALTFALVLVFSVILFDESLTAAKVVGMVLICAGLVVTSL